MHNAIRCAFAIACISLSLSACSDVPAGTATPKNTPAPEGSKRFPSDQVLNTCSERLELGVGFKNVTSASGRPSVETVPPGQKLDVAKAIELKKCTDSFY